MKICPRAFNTYLSALLVLVAAGCRTEGDANKGLDTKKKGKELSTLRFHLETFPDQPERTETIKVHRETPVEVTVERRSCLDEREIEEASVVDWMDTFVLRIRFTRRGGWLLENLTASNIGKRLAISSQFGQTRWLAAPMIMRRISDGVFYFAPDASREEAERIARGLNNAAAALKKKEAF
jgi:preprotein translocase subunit SecD